MTRTVRTITRFAPSVLRLLTGAALFCTLAVEAGAVIPPHLRPARTPAGVAASDEARRRWEAMKSMVADSIAEGTWDDSFNPSGTDGEVFAVAVLGSDLYIGGRFSRIGNVPASNIARWDGRRWHPLISGAGNGVSSMVMALQADGDSLFVGGQFDAAGETPVNNIAVWRPATGTWGRLATGISGEGDAIVTAMLKNGPDLFIAGRFGTAGTTLANNLARWNGTRWSRFKGDVNGLVTALGVNGNNLYVAGVFNAAGSVPVRNIAIYDMVTESWSAAGGGIDSLISAIAVRGNNVYVGGHFSQAGGTPVRNMAVWNEATRAWSAFTYPVSKPPLGDGGFDPAYVYDLVVDGSVLYIGGDFRMGREGTYSFVDSVRGIVGWDLDAGRLVKPAGGIASWNNQLAANVNDMLLVNGMLYVGGEFPIAGGYEAQNVAAYRISDKRWLAFGTSVNGASGKYITGPTPAGRGPYGLRAAAVSGESVYVGGYFSSAGGAASRNIARWSNGVWTALGDGVGGDVTSSGQFMNPEHVNAVLARGAEVFVGGTFSTASGVQVRNLARWDGTAWSAVGSGNGGDFTEVMAMAAVGNDIYIGGSGGSGGMLMRWNGTSLDTVILGFNQAVMALAVDGSDLYVGGRFSSISGAPAGQVIRYNTVNRSWSAVGNGFNGPVRALAYGGGRLYAGGEFDTTGGVEAVLVAEWNGGSWGPVGSGLAARDIGGGVRSLTIFEGKLYAGGSFSETVHSPANFLAMWTGASWIQVDGGMNDNVNALVPRDGDMLVVGDFTSAGTSYAHYVTRWLPTRPASVTVTTGGSAAAASTIAAVVPNPAGSVISFTLRLARRTAVDLSIFDRLGRPVASVVRAELEAGTPTIGWDVSSLPAGTYFCRMTSADGVSSVPFTVLR